MTTDNPLAIAVRLDHSPARLTKSAQRAASGAAGRPVAHWGISEVLRLVDAARARGRGRKGERDALLIQTIFDSALRVSEALGVRPMDVARTPGGYRLQVVGKTGPRPVAVSPSLVAQLQSYAFEHDMGRADTRSFPSTDIGSGRSWTRRRIWPAWRSPAAW